MSILIISLVVVILVILFFIYISFSKQPTVVKNLYLNGPDITPVPSKDIKTPYSALYSVGVWIYVNSFTTVGKPFITYGNSANNGSSQSNPWLFDLRLDNTTPTLYADIAVGTQAANKTESIVISNNFPIQTWVYVVVAVSSNYVDVYMNGKLVMSKKLNIPSMSNAATDKPTFTFQKSDIYLSNLYRWDYSLDPQTVWTYYTKGNSSAQGGPNSKTRSTKMHMNVNLQRDSRNYVYNVF